MKKAILKFELWFNINFGPLLTNEHKRDRLDMLIKYQTKKLQEWQD
jgi:hypothetical protein